MTCLVWLITGATSGIGAAIVRYALSQGDKVLASGRNVESRLGHLQSEHLALLELDISASSEEITKQIKIAWNIFGHIDILMNNAGMSAMKSAEESL
jgi:NADP-dependent 3-hydroxy acid dehydrogenase YdfG